MFNTKHIQVELDPEVQCLGDVGSVAASDPQTHGTVDLRDADGHVNATRAAEGAPEGASLDRGQKRVLDTGGHQVGIEGTVLQGVELRRELDSRQTSAGETKTAEVDRKRGLLRG